jgi:hypothetical protein
MISPTISFDTREISENNQKEYIREKKWKIWEILIIKIITYTLRKSIENNFHSEKKFCLSGGGESERERESSSSLTKFISLTTDNFLPAK